MAKRSWMSRKRTSCDDKKNRNKIAQRKRRAKIKRLKTEDPEKYKNIREKKRRHEAKYQRKVRNTSPEQVFKRYRALISEKVFTFNFLTRMLAPDPKLKWIYRVKNICNLDEGIKAWRNCDFDDAYKAFDAVVEFVDLQLHYDFFLPRSYTQKVNVLYKGNLETIFIPKTREHGWKAKTDTFMLHENKIYHNTFYWVVTDKIASCPFKTVCVKRGWLGNSTRVQGVLELSEFLNPYGLSLENLIAISKQ